LGELVFVGLGLHDEKGVSLKGLEEVETADRVFLELYTSLMPNFSIENFEKIVGKRLCVVSRKQIEEENGKAIFDIAKKGKAVLLVPGDPLIATTHITLRIEAEKSGIKTRVVHGASIISAVTGLSGLHNYKFGKTVTIPFPSEAPPETCYNVICQNKRLGLHTLCLLDIKTEEKRFLSIQEGLEALLKKEEQRKEEIVTMKTLAVGIVRAGSNNPEVKADYVKELLSYDFGKPPYSLIFPGELHFMEAEALIVLADAPEELRKRVK
jgi:diphthine synthase